MLRLICADNRVLELISSRKPTSNPNSITYPKCNRQIYQKAVELRPEHVSAHYTRQLLPRRRQLAAGRRLLPPRCRDQPRVRQSPGRPRATGQGGAGRVERSQPQRVRPTGGPAAMRRKAPAHDRSKSHGLGRCGDAQGDRSMRALQPGCRCKSASGALSIGWS